MASTEREIIGVDERVSVGRAIPLGIQHMMSMFGSTVLVPVLTGLDPNVAIMCSGIGTICYLLVTGGKIPSYLGSSFAFISPIIAIGATQGLDAAMSGVIVSGCVYLIVAGIKTFDYTPAAAATAVPARVDPVKLTISTCGCVASPIASEADMKIRKCIGWTPA